MFYAHTPNNDGRWHELADHLEAVAKLAADHAAVFGSAEAAWWVGILHDAGKAGEEFQAYLRKCAEQPDRRHTTVDHKGAGFLRALEVLQPLAIPIQGHHGGLNDAGTIGEKAKAHARNKEKLDVSLARFDALGLVPMDWAAPAVPDFAQRDRYALEFWLRMLFSALVDADHFDTERHWHPESSALRGSDIGMAALWQQFEGNQQAFIDRLSPEQLSTPVNRVRAEVYDACLMAASHEPGFFRLTVPTGGGKTRSGLAFALKHARQHWLRRVIVAVPYLTITDQTAQIVRSIFPEERVLLEHHSAAGGAADDEDGAQDERALWRRLTAQDWDAPIIVTTMVQLFESLLGRKTGVCRKLHRIAGSVIVLDEAQTIPITLREPIYDVLRELVANYGVSVVLCTATQPALDWLPAEMETVEIVPDPTRHFRALRRVAYDWPSAGEERWNWERAADELRSSPQSLAIVNTVADAAALYEALGDEEGHFHLSSRMCGAHRRDVVARVRERLATVLPCRVVSTQVVEAGVDLDFPLLLRAYGPLDRIVQAAGRCNREGKLDGLGRVVVFDPAEGGMPPGSYRAGTETTALLREMEKNGPLDLDDPAIFDRYFTMLGRVTAADAPAIQQERVRLNYETVAANFHLIDDQDQSSVLVRYRGLEWDPFDGEDAPVDRLIREIEFAIADRNSAWLRGLMRRAQPYLVDVRQRMLSEYQHNGDVRQLTDDLWLWLPEYDDKLGLVSGRLDIAQLIVG